MTITQPVVANDRTYPAPKACAIAICLDGCEPEYLDVAIADGLMPNLKRIRETGTDRMAHSVIPSFTNPNNLSIATGRPASVHGICGNFLYDPDTGEEVMMNDVRFLRAPTVFSRFYEAGARVAVVTAKDKLRALLGAGLKFDEDRGIAFSSERSGETTKAEHGIDNASAWLGMDVPEVYSAELSEFVFAAGVKLLREWKPDVMYLSTTDYIQHKFAPEEQGAKDFYAMFDRYLGELDALGAAVVVTADHGMKAEARCHHQGTRRHLHAGRLRRLAGRRAGPRHPADHRSLTSSTTARLGPLPRPIFPKTRIGATSSRASAQLPEDAGSSDAGRGRREVSNCPPTGLAI